MDLKEAVNQTDVLSPVAEAFAAARRGEILILVDEMVGGYGNLVIPAQWATASVINFMALHARGLICLALTKQRVRQLGLPLLPQRDQSRRDTAFTVSIEAASGVTTGISAADRAATIAVAIDPNSTPDDICTPGHVFPLMAQDGGVLFRAGHAEAAVDLARMAGMTEAAVICAILNDDGAMAAGEEVQKFAQRHDLKILTLAGLISHRRRHEKVVQRTHTSTIESRYGGCFDAHVYTNTVTKVEHLALVKGELEGNASILVGMHAIDFFDDLIESWDSRQLEQLHNNMTTVGAEGRGVIIFLRDVFDTPLAERLALRSARPRLCRDPGSEIRDYCIGAQILADLGVRRIVSLSDIDRRMIGIEGFELTVEGRRRAKTENAEIKNQ